MKKATLLSMLNLFAAISFAPDTADVLFFAYVVSDLQSDTA